MSQCGPEGAPCVLLVGNDPAVRDRFRRACDQGGLTAQLGDRDCLWRSGAPDYDVILLQAATRGGAVRWSRVTKRLRRSIPLVVSVPALDGAAATDALNAGADDIIDASISDGELVARLRAVHRRGRAMPSSDGPKRRSCGALTLDSEGRTALVNGKDLRLRRAEYLILEYLLDRGGNLVTARELSETALGGRHVDGSNLIRVHLTYLRRKLGGLQGAIRTVRGAGYVLMVPSAA